MLLYWGINLRQEGIQNYNNAINPPNFTNR